MGDNAHLMVLKSVNRVYVQILRKYNMDDQQSAIQDLYDNGSLLDILLAVEKYFDDNDLYAYQGVIQGELVAGPITTKYWVEVVFKYTRDNFPDPTAFTTLEKHGTKVQVKADYEIRPIEKPRSRKDMKGVATQNGSVSIPRSERIPILLVKVQIPRSIIDPESFDEYKLMASEFNSNPTQDLEQPEEDMSMNNEQDVDQMDNEFGNTQNQQGGM